MYFGSWCFPWFYMDLIYPIFNNFLQLINAPNSLWHEHAILTRCFSKDAQAAFGKRDGKLHVSISGVYFLVHDQTMYHEHCPSFPLFCSLANTSCPWDLVNVSEFLSCMQWGIFVFGELWCIPHQCDCIWCIVMYIV